MLSAWWLLAGISGLGLATRNLLFKVVNSKMDVALAAFILSLGMFAVAAGYLVWERVTEKAPLVPQNLDVKAGLICLVAGAAVAFANIFLAAAYKADGFASLVAILQNGVAITVTVVIGALLLGEFVKPIQLAGIVLAFAGMALIVKG